MRARRGEVGVRTVVLAALVAAAAAGVARANGADEAGAGRAAVAGAEATSAVLVLEFELNDLTLYPKVEQEQARVASLRPLLVEDLEAMDAIAPLAPPQAAEAEADKGRGYLFERPALAAALGREAGADWVVSGRLHKASHLFVYLKAQLIEPTSARVAADFVVEIKGWGERLTAKGVESLAVQIGEAIATLERGGGAPGEKLPGG